MPRLRQCRSRFNIRSSSSCRPDLWLCGYLEFGLNFTAVRVAVFATVLLGIAITDAKHYLIPDGFTVFGVFWVLVSRRSWRCSSARRSRLPRACEALIGACVGAGAIAIAGWLGEVALKNEAMGFGDVTLMAVVGAAVGPARALITIFFAALIATVVFLGIVYPIARRRATTRDRRSSAAASSGSAFFCALPFGVSLLWRADRLLFGVR